jgi:hypothetical protein
MRPARCGTLEDTLIEHIRLGRPGVVLQVERDGVLAGARVRAVICESSDRQAYAGDLAVMLGFDGFVLREPGADTWIPAGGRRPAP